jgi:uncharacterized membrane protein
MKPIYKALFWNFWNMIFGVAPFLIFGYLWMSLDDQILSETAKREIFHLIRDWIFIFFYLVMIASVSVDFLFSKHPYPNYAYFIMGVIPSGVFGIVAVNYSALILNKLEITNIQRLMLVQIIAFATATTFCIFVKENILSKENDLAKSINHE